MTYPVKVIPVSFNFLCLSTYCIILFTDIGVVAAVRVPFEDGSLERINIRREKLKEMCDIRGETLYDNILSFDSSLGAHLSFFFEVRLFNFLQRNKFNSHLAYCLLDAS